MNKLFNIITNFIKEKFYIILSILYLFVIAYDYLQNGFTKYIFIFVIFEIYNILKIFNFKIFEKKIFNILPKNKFIYIIFLICLYSMVNTYRLNAPISVYQQVEGVSATPPVLLKEVRHAINVNEGSFDTISLQIGTYSRTNNAKYSLTIYEDDKELYSTKFYTIGLTDGKYANFSFPTINVNKDKNYWFSIKSIKADSNNCIAIFTNGEENGLNYKIFDSSHIDWLKLIVIVMSVLVFFIINFIINTYNISTDKVYMLFAIYIFSFIFIVPSLNTPDEWLHYARSYKLSQKINYMNNSTFLNTDTYNGPDNECLFYGDPQNQSGKVNRELFNDCLKNHDNHEHDAALFSYMSSTNPIVHFVQSIGVKIFDVFSNSPLVIFWGGRIFNCLVAFLIILYSIKNSSKNKLLILFVATIPMFVQQMISYSYDGLVNAFSLFFLYLTMKNFEDDKYKILDYILLVLGTLYIMCTKLIYVPLILPLFFNKVLVKMDMKSKIKWIVMLVSILLVSYLFYNYWGTYSNKIYNLTSELMKTSEGTNYYYITHNPLAILDIARNTFGMYGEFYLQSTLGYFGWFIYKFDNIIYLIYLVMFVIIITNKDYIESKLNIKHRIISILCCLVSFGLVFAAMYFTWSIYKLEYVDGVQGRYFLPLIGLFTLALATKHKINYKLNEKDLYTFINIMLLLTIIISFSIMY